MLAFCSRVGFYWDESPVRDGCGSRPGDTDVPLKLYLACIRVGSSSLSETNDSNDGCLEPLGTGRALVL